MRWFTVPPSVLLSHYLCSTISVTLSVHCSIMIVPQSDAPLFHLQMFYCPTIRYFTVTPSLFHHSTIRCSTVPSSDVPLFPRRMFHCSTIRSSTVPPSDVPLFHHLCYTVSPLDIPLFHLDCSTVPPSHGPVFHHLCSTVPLSLFHCSTISVPLFHHLCSTVSPSLLHCSTIRCSTVPS